MLHGIPYAVFYWRKLSEISLPNRRPVGWHFGIENIGRGSLMSLHTGEVDLMNLLGLPIILKRISFCAIAFCVASLAQAGTIEIQFSGLNLVYNGSSIFDAGGIPGGSGDPAQSDPLSSMSILVDGDLVGSVLTSDIFADVLIQGVEDIPVGGGAVTSDSNFGGFGFDLLTKNELGGWGLGLNLDEIQIFYSGNKIFLAGGGTAFSLFEQDLPFGVEFNPTQPINISFTSAALTGVTDDGTFLTGFNSSGTGNVRGTMRIPEPATLGMALVCGLVLQTYMTRRRWKS
jgi:hypothetical protein